MAFCPHCGSQVSSETRFCPACGKQIAQNQAPQQPQYGPQQPQYGSQQPQYGPQQPQYGSQQPQYGPQQPQYGPQQPQYGPQQPQYGPQQSQYGFNYGKMAQAVPAPGFVDCVKMFLRRWSDFEGRSRRSEYWFPCLAVILFNMAAYIILMIFALMCGASILSGNFDAGGFFGVIFWLLIVVLGFLNLGLCVPHVAVVVRRLHDQGISGWVALGMLGLLIPFVNFLVSIAFVVLMCRDSQPFPNEYGPSPKYVA